MTEYEPGGVDENAGNAYNIFILVLTLMSLAIMVLIILPVDAATLQLLQVYDNVICFIFLADFALNLKSSRPKSYYFITQRGWLDLLGSIPSLEAPFGSRRCSDWRALAGWRVSADC